MRERRGEEGTEGGLGAALAASRRLNSSPCRQPLPELQTAGLQIPEAGSLSGREATFAGSLPWVPVGRGGTHSKPLFLKLSVCQVCSSSVQLRTGPLSHAHTPPSNAPLSGPQALQNCRLQGLGCLAEQLRQPGLGRIRVQNQAACQLLEQPVAPGTTRADSGCLPPEGVLQ